MHMVRLGTAILGVTKVMRPLPALTTFVGNTDLLHVVEDMTSMPRPPLRIFSRSWMAASVPCAQQEPQYTCSIHEIDVLVLHQMRRDSIFGAPCYLNGIHIIDAPGCAGSSWLCKDPVRPCRTS
jgi:hypothetical protein